MSSPSLPDESPVEYQVVLLIHGIRTQADWGPMVKSILEIPDKIVVIPIRYGYFDAFRFWFPFRTRRVPVQRVLTQIRAAIHRYGRGRPSMRMSIVAHSFGTYIVGEILRNEFDLHFHKLVLCGSVLPQDFPWHQVIGRFDQVINECGKSDIWPVLARSTSWGYGDSGTHGFGAALVTDRFHPGGHGQYFTREFVRGYWEPLFKKSIFKNSSFGSSMPPTPQWMSVLGNFPLKLLIALCITLTLMFGSLSSYLAAPAAPEAPSPSDDLTPPKSEPSWNFKSLSINSDAGRQLKFPPNPPGAKDKDIILIC